ncbi:MAG: hypothetical protein WBF77_09860, partial [Sulfurimonadaceae bacterium]
KKEFCETMSEYIDTRKPSIAAKLEEIAPNVQQMSILMTAQIYTLAQKYNIEFKNTKWTIVSSK